VDLFNAGYYWEAHEAWEGCWHAVGRSGAVAALLKGLIRLAACGVKAREGRHEGVLSHAAAAERHFEQAREELGPHALGLDLSRLAELARLARAAEMRLPSEPPVRRVFPFTLELAMPSGGA
jgi:predicted metal-dependent hydrolase